MRLLMEDVVKWAEEKGILDNSTSLRQFVKTQEEVTELLDALTRGHKVDTADALGDVLVTLIILAELEELDLEQCLDDVLQIITKRTGAMVDGVFVKND